MKQIGPALEGLAVWLKTISSVALPGGSRPNESVSEVTELFEGTLPDKVFVPRVGYQQVTTLPYAASRPALPSLGHPGSRPLAGDQAGSVLSVRSSSSSSY